MKKIVFATNNVNKLQEIRKALSGAYEVCSLAEIGCFGELPETHETLEENALEKARYVADNYGVDCFADDTGLEICSLNGAPGVYSARYAGSQRNAIDNMQKVLTELSGVADRNARFRTVIALVQGEDSILFEGVVNGNISNDFMGSEGFGYDPIFIPSGSEKSFAQMSMSEKNAISHRGRAVQKLLAHLNVVSR